MSLGLASVILATSASAQNAAEPSATALPPLEVTAKKAVAKKKALPKPAPVATISPEAVAQQEPPAQQDPTATFTPASGNTLQSGTGLGRLPGTAQDTPQTVTIVSKRRIQEQNLTTVDQALRTVPGISVTSGYICINLAMGYPCASTWQRTQRPLDRQAWGIARKVGRKAIRRFRQSRDRRLDAFARTHFRVAGALTSSRRADTLTSL